MRLASLFALATILSAAPGCAIFRQPVRDSADEPAPERANPTPAQGAFADLGSAVWVPSTTLPAPSIVQLALNAAITTSRGERGGAAQEPDGAGAASLGPFFAAWLHVDEAANLARVAAAPAPEPSPISAEQQQLARTERDVPPGELHLRVLNTRERYHVRVYDNDGRMRPEAVRELARALRDQRANAARSPDLRLIAMLYLIGQHYDAELEVVSGYRVRNLNATEGSRHGAAAACDIRIEGVSIRELARHAETHFADVGVGYYPNSNFVHVDARPRSYFWIDYSDPDEPSRPRSRTVTERAERDQDVTLRSIHVTEEELYQLPPALTGFGYE